jgi:uncharacterized protein YpmB
MKPKTQQILIISISAILGLLSIIFGNKLWTFLGINDISLQASLISISSIFIIFFGFLISYFSLLSETQEKVIELKTDLIAEIKSFLPHTDNFKVYNGTEALKIIAEKLNQTQLTLNTKLASKDFDVDKFYVGGTDSFPKAVKSAVKNGMVFKEIAANYGVKMARELKADINSLKNVSGRYEGYEINIELNSMINFVILQFRDGTKEIWFGWLVSKGRDIDQSIYRSTDVRLIGLFETWHSDICRNGTPI